MQRLTLKKLERLTAFERSSSERYRRRAWKTVSPRLKEGNNEILSAVKMLVSNYS